MDDFEKLKKTYNWGPNSFYHFAANKNIHPTYIQTMLNDKKYNILLEELNSKIKISEDKKAEKKALKEEQLALIDELTKNQIMFKRDIHDFWDIMEKNNWDHFKR